MKTPFKPQQAAQMKVMETAVFYWDFADHAQMMLLIILLIIRSSSKCLLSTKST